MSNDDNSEVRVALLESKVDNLLAAVAELRRDSATKDDIASLQRQIDALREAVKQLDARIGQIELRIALIEQRLDHIEAILPTLATREELLAVKAELKVEMKAEFRRLLLIFAFAIITIQTSLVAGLLALFARFLLAR